MLIAFDCLYETALCSFTLQRYTKNHKQQNIFEKKWKSESEKVNFQWEQKNTPLKDYVLLRDKRRNIVKKKGVVLTRVHYYIRVP